MRARAASSRDSVPNRRINAERLIGSALTITVGGDNEGFCRWHYRDARGHRLRRIPGCQFRSVSDRRRQPLPARWSGHWPVERWTSTPTSTSRPETIPCRSQTAALTQGATEYEEHCAFCHGGAKAKISPMQDKFNPPAPAARRPHPARRGCLALLGDQARRPHDRYADLGRRALRRRDLDDHRVHQTQRTNCRPEVQSVWQTIAATPRPDQGAHARAA